MQTQALNEELEYGFLEMASRFSTEGRRKILSYDLPPSVLHVLLQHETEETTKEKRKMDAPQKRASLPATPGITPSRHPVTQNHHGETP
jgi:hypothetical protein